VDPGPRASAGPNSADSHYDPPAPSSRPIRKGDFVLIDIWGKLANDPTAVWYDITWTGVVGRDPTERDQLILPTPRPGGPGRAPTQRERLILPPVRNPRVGSIKIVQDPSAANQPIAGWQAD